MFRNDDSNATTDYNLGIIMKNASSNTYTQIGFLIIIIQVVELSSPDNIEIY